MSKSTWIWIVVILVILGIWYMMSSKKKEPVVTTTPPTTETGTKATGPSGDVEPNIVKPGSGVIPLISVSSSATLGNYLVGKNKMTLYTYSKDTKGVSNCSGTCAATWIPHTTTAGTSLIAGAGATGDFSVISRSDGTKHLTYNGMPLYTYKNDTLEGDTKGQNFGGMWFLVKP